MSENLGLCCICGEPIGRAGRDEDSLFKKFNDGDIIGPLCKICFDEVEEER